VVSEQEGLSSLALEEREHFGLLQQHHQRIFQQFRQRAREASGEPDSSIR
jgi:hypothetical protein